ncbi:TIGR04282 family arsenosugar biosynthesis glycosyltransferase [Amycolatopsis sp. NPDC004378]
MDTPVIVLVLAKAPQTGLVKTRLCPPATPLQAARVAAASLMDTLAAVAATPGTQPVLALAGDLADAEAGPRLRQIVDGVPVVRQRGTGLGERIAAAHRDAAVLFPGQAVLQIGMDTPQVTPSLLDGCRRSLAAPGVDAALGFAEDGGWWLLGLRDPLRAASIAHVPTSRADTGKRTLLALRTSGLTVCPLPRLSDVDTYDDARTVAATLPGSRFAAAVRDIR